jgi:hypothetical protein
MTGYSLLVEEGSKRAVMPSTRRTIAAKTSSSDFDRPAKLLRVLAKVGERVWNCCDDLRGSPQLDGNPI